MMATKFLMQANDSIQGLVSWTSDLPDWAASGSPGSGTVDVNSVAIAGGGFDAATSIPDGAMTYDDGSLVVFDDGSYVVTT